MRRRPESNRASRRTVARAAESVQTSVRAPVSRAVHSRLADGRQEGHVPAVLGEGRPAAHLHQPVGVGLARLGANLGSRSLFGRVAADTARLIAVGALGDGLWLIKPENYVSFFCESYNFLTRVVYMSLSC